MTSAEVPVEHGEHGDAGTAPAVEVRDLVKRYPKGRVNAVDGVSFAVTPGEVFGLLGPNGAGKTTTVGVLTTRVRPTGGTAWVAGVDVAADPVRARRLVAVVPQRNNLDRSLSIRQNLLFHAAYHGVPPTSGPAGPTSCWTSSGSPNGPTTKPDEFSGGQAQRLMVARALMHDPQVLFLDEPTTGLDPQARLFVWDRVAELAARGVTIVLTTHDMDEAAKLADRVGIVDHGKLLALDTPGGADVAGCPAGRPWRWRSPWMHPRRGAAGRPRRLEGVERVERVAAARGPAAFAGDPPGMGGPPGPPPGAGPPDGAGGPGAAGPAASPYAPLMVAPVAGLLAGRQPS